MFTYEWKTNKKCSRDCCLCNSQRSRNCTWRENMSNTWQTIIYKALFLFQAIISRQYNGSVWPYAVKNSAKLAAKYIFAEWLSMGTYAGIDCWWKTQQIYHSLACCSRCCCSHTTVTDWYQVIAHNWVSSPYLQHKREALLVSVTVFFIIIIGPFLV